MQILTSPLSTWLGGEGDRLLHPIAVPTEHCCMLGTEVEKSRSRSLSHHRAKMIPINHTFRQNHCEINGRHYAKVRPSQKHFGYADHRSAQQAQQPHVWDSHSTAANGSPKLLPNSQEVTKTLNLPL